MGHALFCVLNILDDNLSVYLAKSMGVGNVRSNKWTHLMGRSKRFVIFFSQWVGRASASGGRLGYNATDALETSCRGLIEISIFRFNSRNSGQIMIIPLRFHRDLQSL